MEEFPKDPVMRKKILDGANREELKKFVESAESSLKYETRNPDEYFCSRAAIAKLEILESHPAFPAIFIKDYLTFLVK
ncbi:MAG: hypothetical protein AAB930_02180 [Patescibacteria group bacterium]